jgi:ATP-dependent protease ClpP protease subunit|nr:MAG TPA: Putative ATP dependent Clp protease [Caudoviricetes sp.]
MSFAYDLKKSEIHIYGVIGDPEWGMIGAMDVIDALKKMEGKRVTARINTPGGSVDEGIPMFNAMMRHDGGVDTVVDGLAASMGSYLMLAGVNRRIARNSMVMIHNPMTIAWGNSGELRKTADVLDQYRERMLPDYSEKTGKTIDELKTLLDAETWYVGQAIIDNGFAQSMDDRDADEPQTKGLKMIAAKSIAAGLAPRALFEKRAKAIQQSIDPRPRLTAAKVAAMQLAQMDKD